MRFIRFGDVLTAAAVVILAAALWLVPVFMPAESGTLCKITKNGELIGTYPLETDAEITVGAVRVSIASGEVRVTDSDCPDRLCVRTGAIRRAGQMIVCLPERVAVQIVSGETGVDAVA